MESLRGLTKDGFAMPKTGALEVQGCQTGEPTVWVYALIGLVYQFGLLAY